MDEVTKRPGPAPSTGVRGGYQAPAGGEKPKPPTTGSGVGMKVPEATPEPPPTEYKVRLLAPVEAHGDTVSELTFREPTGGDIVRFGNPIKLDLYMNEENMEAQMAALAGVPPSTIRQLKARDWNTIAFELLARFFAPSFGGPRA